jgi:ribosomal protein S18 acetylase RimI-like enzyme
MSIFEKSYRIYGGLIGNIYKFCLYIEILWISENRRGLGYGRKLLEAVELMAKNEACVFVYLDTFNFQAPEFYQKNGYEVYGILDLYPGGIKQFYLKKEF